MKRIAPKNLDPPRVTTVQPGGESAALSIGHAARLMAPIAVWLLRNGVSYPAFTKMMKSVFIEAARAELRGSGIEPTQSALSLMSGVHRKDVRDLSDADQTRPTVVRPTLSSQVYTLWLMDARYSGTGQRPRPLPRVGPPPSFETLCREISNDVHPRALLDELLRLRQVAIEDDLVRPLSDAFVPAEGLEERTALFATNVSDHVSAAVNNLTTDGPRFLEQALYADGLRRDSVETLNKMARKTWAGALKTMASEARRLVQVDRKSDGNLRLGFGMYFFSEPANGPASRKPAAKAAPSLKPSRTVRSSR